MDQLLPDDPDLIGPYRLEGRLGAGGMGEVFLARSPGGRVVVVKRIHRHHARDPEFRVRFTREIDAARRVGGHFTAQVIAADPAADLPWMAAAHIPGPSLQALVSQRGPLPVETVIALGAALAEGLAAIHDCGLIHRDLKPANVICADDGPRIIDFGIARPLDAAALTETGALVGTYSHMSPERINGHPATPAADVFSLGCVLVFAATGQSPYAASTLPAVIHRITSGDPDLTRVTADLRPLITACLTTDPAARPAVAEILATLGPAAHRRPPGNPWPAAHQPPPGILPLDGHQPLPGDPWPAAHQLSPGNPSRVAHEPLPGDPSLAAHGPPPGNPPLAAHRPAPGYASPAAHQQPSGGPSPSGRSSRPGYLSEGFSPPSQGSPSGQLSQGERPLPLLSRILPRRALLAGGVAVGATIVVVGASRIFGGEEPVAVTKVSARLVKTLTGHEGEVYSVASNPDGTLLASGGADRTVRLWDPAGVARPGTLAGHESNVYAVAFTGDARLLISGGGDRLARLWDVADRVTLTSLPGGDDGVNAVASTDDGTVIATGGGDGTVRLWDPASGARTAVLTGHGGAVMAVSFSPDGKRLATSGTDETVRIWDVARRALLHTLTAHEGWVSAVAFSPDGKLLVSGGADRVVRLWDPADGTETGTLPGHDAGIAVVAFSRDGRVLATGSGDRTVRLWDPADRTRLATLTGHTAAVGAVAFNHDGTLLATGGADATVRLWEIR
ncbi:serine/threonine-protein kinase [Herbidospora galbida]|uniref:serine/threonine-protein kinase n=1 Tax=Herbidospora galbida TaxID=2575442 RepID=UPI001484F6F1|nr:serine/threonine-protein kinase [Herbidospora galbida]